MGPKQAMRNGILKTFQFSGRASRSEFWYFAPVAVLPVILGLYLVPWHKIELFGIWRWLGVMVLGLPLLSAGWRRINDTGENGQMILLPFMPIILLWVGYQAILWFAVGTAFVGVGVVGMVIGFGTLFMLFPLYFAALLISFISLGPVIGQLVLPSTPGPNRFGPIPHEVTP